MIHRNLNENCSSTSHQERHGFSALGNRRGPLDELPPRRAANLILTLISVF